MMHSSPKLTTTPPIRWEGHVCLDPREAALVVRFLPRHVAIRRLIQVTAAKAAVKAKRLNKSPGTV
jgi:hypothetical protein